MDRDIEQRLTRHLATEADRHAKVGVRYPLSVDDFDGGEIVALAFMSKKEREEPAMQDADA